MQVNKFSKKKKDKIVATFLSIKTGLKKRRICKTAKIEQCSYTTVRNYLIERGLLKPRCYNKHKRRALLFYDNPFEFEKAKGMIREIGAVGLYLHKDGRLFYKSPLDGHVIFVTQHAKRGYNKLFGLKDEQFFEKNNLEWMVKFFESALNNEPIAINSPTKAYASSVRGYPESDLVLVLDGYKLRSILSKYSRTSKSLFSQNL